MSRRGSAEARRLGEIATVNPTLTLLGAYSRDWVLPLFAEHLEPVEGSVSADWFHERVAEALQEAREDKEWQGDRSPSSRCAWWVKQRWLDTEMGDTGVRYRLSPYSLRALRFVREIAEGESTVSGARLGSIAHAVRRMADMTSPDRFAQAQRIEEEIAELQRRKQEVLEGRGGTATVAQLSEHLREVLVMTRSLPADCTIRTKFGAQPIHTHLDIPGTAALAGLNPGTASHWQRARARWDELRYHQPGQAVRPWLARIVDFDNYDFITLLAATTCSPRSGTMIHTHLTSRRSDLVQYLKSR